MFTLEHTWYPYLCSLSATDPFTMCMCLYTCLHKHLKSVYLQTCAQVSTSIGIVDYGSQTIYFVIFLSLPKHTIYSSGCGCDRDNSVMDILNKQY